MPITGLKTVYRFDDDKVAGNYKSRIYTQKQIVSYSNDLFLITSAEPSVAIRVDTF